MIPRRARAIACVAAKLRLDSVVRYRVENWSIDKQRNHHDARERTRLRTLDTGCLQLPDFHHLRVQFRQAAEPARLAFVRRVRRFPGGALRRDVRLSVDDLPVVGLAGDEIPRYRFPLARRWPLARSDVRLANQSAFRALSLAQHGIYRRWILASVGRLVGSLCQSTRRYAGTDRTLRAYSTPSVRCLCPDHVRVLVAMADTGDARDVPDSLLHVLPTFAHRGARIGAAVRGGLGALCIAHASLHPGVQYLGRCAPDGLAS